MKIMNNLLPIFLLLFMTPVIAGSFKVEKPWIREAPPGMKMLAGYMTFENNKNGAVNFVGARSPDFKSIEIHHTVTKDDVATMIQRQAVKILPFSTLKFEPKGLHLMLIGPKRELKEGDKVKIVLKFSNYRKLKVVFPVRKEGSGMQHHHH